MNSQKIKRMVGIASLAAVVVVLQLIANYIPGPGGVSITLALIPLVIGITGGVVSYWLLNKRNKKSPPFDFLKAKQGAMQGLQAGWVVRNFQFHIF